MRKIEYLSPTSIAKWEESKDEFYLTYLADVRAPRFAQTLPMGMGSAFDAYVKSFLHENLFGKDNDPRFNLRKLFEAQVEEQNRDFCWEHGEHAFECYRKSGALADLMLELQTSVGTPRFEIEVRGAISGYREGASKTISPTRDTETRTFKEILAADQPVTFLGKPDVFYINRYGTHVILDFKVNGWLSKSAVSPMPGYIRVRGVSPSGPHKDCMVMSHNGAMINVGQFLDQLDKKWADQLAIYGFLCGADVGSDFIVAIDQLCCKPSGAKFPLVRIAEHRLRINKDYQWRLLARAQEIWEIVHSKHIFRDLSQSDSQTKCEFLDKQAKDLHAPATEEERIFNEMTRGTGSNY